MKCCPHLRSDQGLWPVAIRKLGLVSSAGRDKSTLLGSQSVTTNFLMPKITLSDFCNGSCQGDTATKVEVCFGILRWILKRNSLFKKKKI